MEQLSWIRSVRRLVTLRYAGTYGARSPRLTAGARPVRQCVTPSTKGAPPLETASGLHRHFLHRCCIFAIGTVDELLILHSTIASTD